MTVECDGILRTGFREIARQTNKMALILRNGGRADLQEDVVSEKYSRGS